MPMSSHPGACRCSACSRTGCVNLLMGCHPLGRARSWYSNTSNCRLLLSGEVERITCQCSCCTFTQLPEAAASQNSSLLMSSDEEMLSLLLRCFASFSAFFCGRPCAPLIKGSSPEVSSSSLAFGAEKEHIVGHLLLYPSFFLAFFFLPDLAASAPPSPGAAGSPCAPSWPSGGSSPGREAGAAPSSNR